VTLTSTAAVFDPDDLDLVSATVAITGGTFAGDGDVLSALTAGTSIAASYNSTSETLTLTGSDALAHYQQVLDSVTFDSTSPSPTNGGADPTRTVTWLLNDGSGTANGGAQLSTPITSTISVTTRPLVPLNAPGTIVMIGDFTGGPDADIVWVTNGGTPIMWVMNGTTVASTAVLPTPPPAAWHLSEVGDFNGDGKSDLLWLNNVNNTPSMWLMNGTAIISGTDLPAPPTSWNIVGGGDFNGDGKADILWQNSDNTPSIWEMNGPSFVAAVALPAPPMSWKIVGTGDFYGNGDSDILWLNANNTACLWEMNGTSLVTATALPAPPPSWHLVGTADFNGDGKADIMWQNSNGDVSIWEMNAANFLAAVDVGSPGAAWRLIGAGDFTGNGKSDLLFVNPSTDQAEIWLMNGTQVLSTQSPASYSSVASGHGVINASQAVLSQAAMSVSEAPVAVVVAHNDASSSLSAPVESAAEVLYPATGRDPTAAAAGIPALGGSAAQNQAAPSGRLGAAASYFGGASPLDAWAAGTLRDSSLVTHG
jgi:hypothetical protein